MSLQDQIDDAKKHIRKLARAAPYLFPEWQRYKNAQRRVVQAKKELEMARAAWEERLK